MITTKHIAIYVADAVAKSELINSILTKKLLSQYIDISQFNCAEVSKNAQEKLINEELRHDNFQLKISNQRNLISFSDGEQKKALLQYILSFKPNCIIVENIFDHLDIDSQKNLTNQLTNLSSTITFIQIVNRKADILPFIETVLCMQKNGDLLLLKEATTYNITSNRSVHIPQAIEPYKNITNPLVQFNEVTVFYEDKCVVRNINWQINKGEFWQLIGPNGSGKSTLLSMITGDNPKAYNQDLILFGKKKGTGETVWEIKAKIGYVNSLMTHLFERRDTVENMIISGLNDSIGLYVKPTEVQIKTTEKWLRLIELYEIKHKVFVDVSKGQQRLIMIARAMIKHPPLLILDEPTTGLDDDDATLFTTLINKIAAETNTAIVYVSHRKEIGLEPQFIYELIANKNGSVGKILKHKGKKTQSCNTL